MNGLHHTNQGRRQLLAAALFFSSLFGFGWAAYRFKPIWPPLGTASRLAQPPATLPDFVSLAKRFDPSLVHIATLDTRPLHGLDDSASDSAPRRPGARGSLGAGIIIHRDGHIVTNDHVVAHAEKIFVKLANRRELDATVVGLDTRSDIALIKVAAPHALTAASLGDSSLLQTGEWVVAMGSPFGLDRTLTAGIVSATTRRIAAAAYYDYIQTDVSINPGNSGGPLLNLQGRGWSASIRPCSAATATTPASVSRCRSISSKNFFPNFFPRAASRGAGWEFLRRQ